MICNNSPSKFQPRPMCLFLLSLKVVKVERFIRCLDRVSVPSPIVSDILMDSMAGDRVHIYLFSVGILNSIFLLSYPILLFPFIVCEEKIVT